MEQILLNGINVDELLQKIEKLLDTKLKPQPPNETKQDFVSRSEVATLLKITLPTLNEWTKLGWLQSYKIGNRVLYKFNEVLESVKKTSFNKHKKYLI